MEDLLLLDNLFDISPDLLESRDPAIRGKILSEKQEVTG
jgi:hypothetical protein